MLNDIHLAKGGVWMTNRDELDKAIKEAGVKLSAICERCGFTYATFRSRRSGETEFTVSEINAICELCHLSSEQRDRIFFAHKGE